MKKKVLFVVILIASCLASQAWAQNFTSTTPNGHILNYTVNGDNTSVTVTGYTGGLSGVLDIPNTVTYGGVTYAVTEIGSLAFSHNDSIIEVIIPDNVTTLHYGVFYWSNGIQSITIGSGVTTVDVNVFSGNAPVTYLNYNCPADIPNKMGSTVNNIEILIVGDNVDSIRGEAFIESVRLKNLTVGSGLKYISTGHWGAFFWCDSIVNLDYNCGLLVDQNGDTVDLPSVLNHTQLTTVTIGDSVRIITEEAFLNAGNLSSVAIGDNITTIGARAFQGCSNLGAITFPETLSSIRENAFFNCSSLDTISFLGTTPPNIWFTEMMAGYYTVPFPYGTVFNIPCGTYDAYCSAWYVNNNQTVISNGSSMYYWSYYGRQKIYEPVVELLFDVQTVDTLQGYGYIVYHDGLAYPSMFPNPASCIDSSVVVYAYPEEGFRFDHWSNGSTANPDTLYLTGDSSVTAFFVIDTVFAEIYIVTVNSTDTTMGTVSAGGEVEEGDSFTIRATANDGYHFLRWNDGDTNAERTVVVTSDTTFTAYFEADEVVTTYTVTVVSANPEMGTVGAGGEVEEGESFTIRAIANEGYHFTHWNDGDTNAERTVVVTSDTTFTAYFEADGGTEGIGGIEAVNAKVYAEHGRIVVEGVEGETVSVFDVAGRQVKNSDLHAGVYMVKIGSAPARKVVVTR